MAKKENLKIKKEQENLIKQKQAEFDALSEVLANKKYEVELDKDLFDFFIDYFLENIKWKGVDVYAIEKIYEESDLFRSGYKQLLDPDIINAIFIYIKDFSAKGLGIALTFKKFTDAFAKPMAQINEDRYKLQEVSLELVAAENGISVEDYKKDMLEKNE